MGEENIPLGEEATIEQMLATMREIQERSDRRHRPVRRNLHPKQHGCLRAVLVIEPDLPAALRHGIFGEARSFPAVVRLSSAKMPDDRLPDAHGMAVKVLEVDGPKLLPSSGSDRTQDFVCVDHPIFFARDAADLLALIEDYRGLMLGSLWTKVRVLLRAAVSTDHRYRILRAMALKRPSDLLAIQYWSTTPFKIGSSAMKLSFRPQPLPVRRGPTPGSSADRYRRTLVSRLAREEARFDVVAQLQTDAARMPIEDATARWDERASPWVKLATLLIPAQTFDTPEQMAFGEQLSFTPWHALAEHRPLGGINRARRKIYHAMADRRRELNGAPAAEPTLADVDVLWRDGSSGGW